MSDIVIDTPRLSLRLWRSGDDEVMAQIRTSVFSDALNPTIVYRIDRLEWAGS